jgi:hypothetical protein
MVVSTSLDWLNRWFASETALVRHRSLTGVVRCWRWYQGAPFTQTDGLPVSAALGVQFDLILHYR